jgi:exopolyphosphatase / guanosine-5'-triphosphate,3'-diphosphate pyrophosphatase
VLLLVGQRGPDGRVEVVLDEARITRLGRGVDRVGRLDSEAVERTLVVLEQYREIARVHDAELVVVATEGLRMAADRDVFVQRAQTCLGCSLRIVSGDEEAELSYLSVAHELPADTPLRVLDIGGGSTELVVGRGTVVGERRSHRIGSVRLTERFVQHDPPTSREVAQVEAATWEALASQVVEPFETLHGLAGTVTTAAALLLGLEVYDREAVDGLRVQLADVVALRDELAAETLELRVRRPMLPAGRADVIVAGLSILGIAMQHCGASSLVVRDRGLRYALL